MSVFFFGMKDKLKFLLSIYTIKINKGKNFLNKKKFMLLFLNENCMKTFKVTPNVNNIFHINVTCFIITQFKFVNFKDKRWFKFHIFLVPEYELPLDSIYLRYFHHACYLNCVIREK